MNANPLGIWRRLLFHFILPTLAFFIAFLAIDWNSNPENYGTDWLTGAICAIAITATLWATFFFIRWLCCWRNFRRCLIVVGCFAVLVAVFYLEENWRGKRAWENFKHEWEAKGEKFDLAELAPPPVPDDQNFALTPIVASCYSGKIDRHGHAIQPENTNVINRLKMDVNRTDYFSNTNTRLGNWQKAQPADLKAWQEYFRARFKTNVTWEYPPELNSQSEPVARETVVLLATNEFPIAPQPQTPAADVLLALSRFDPAIEELRQASQLPYSRFPLAYDLEMPATMLIPHLEHLKYCSQVLRLRIAAELQLGQTEQALADIKLALRLTDSSRNEPILISHLVRAATWQITLNGIWEGLAEHRWTNAQLTALDHELAKLDFLSDLRFSMRGVLAGDIGNIDYVRRQRTWRKFRETLWQPDIKYSLSDWREFIFSMSIYQMPSGWYYQNELTIAQAIQQYTLAMADPGKRLSPLKAEREFDITLVKLVMTKRPWNFFARMFIPNLANAGKKFAFSQSSVDLARTAIALERYRLAQGNYPDSLAALAPQFIAQVPHDVIGGQSLHYRRTDDGQFILYSVGWNEKDDSGTVALRKSGRVDTDEGDWVWRYPAR